MFNRIISIVLISLMAYSSSFSGVTVRFEGNEFMDSMIKKRIEEQVSLIRVYLSDGSYDSIRGYLGDKEYEAIVRNKDIIIPRDDVAQLKIEFARYGVLFNTKNNHKYIIRLSPCKPLQNNASYVEPSDFLCVEEIRNVKYQKEVLARPVPSLLPSGIPEVKEKEQEAVIPAAYRGGPAAAGAAKTANEEATKQCPGLIDLTDKIKRDLMLLDRALAGDVANVKDLIKLGANVNVQTSRGINSGITPLQLTYNEEITDLLLKAGADVNASDSFGSTALTWAVLSGNIAQVELLIDAGADVNARDKDGNTILTRAVSAGNPQIVTRLIRAGADINATDADNKTALDIARQRGHGEIINLLEIVMKKKSKRVYLI